MVNQTRIRTWTNVQDPTEPFQVHTLEIFTPGTHGTPGYWKPIEESRDLPPLQRLQQVLDIPVTTIEGTDKECLGTFSQVRVYLFPHWDMPLLIARLDLDHHFTHCECEHDCCGHVCSSNYEILVIVPHNQTLSLALVRSEYSINV
jgi:hypothetical protein